LRNLSLEFEKPVINGILTTNTEQQAIDRAGIKFSKGSEYAKAREDLLSILGTINKE
jgi:6,7-dimethyl-8-ribityllumazine synthase